MKTIFGDWPRANDGVLALQLSKYALTGGLADNAPRFYNIALDSTGAIPVGQQIWANDELMPEGTQYQTVITDVNQLIIFGPQMLSICGPDPIDMNQFIPMEL